MTSASKEFKMHRSTADRLRKEVEERIRSFNADNRRTLCVTRAVIFGSYVNDPGKEMLSDLDVGLEMGNRFEPDFLLFLKRKGKEKEFDQFQAFIEPKGDILLEQDRWKQEFLLQLRKRWVGSDITFLDDSEFVVLGLPFYNEANNKEFVTAFGELLIDESREGFQ